MTKLLLSLLALISLVACKTRLVPVDVHHYHRDSVLYVQRDTILERDSVIIQQRGDTLYIRETSDRIQRSKGESVTHQADSIAPPRKATPILLEEPKPPPDRGSSSLIIIALLGALLPIVAYLSHKITKKITPKN